MEAILKGLDLLIIVPARGGSKRLPGKNLMKIGGRSLLGWTAQFLEAEGLLANAILSTDDLAIAEEGRTCGLRVPFMRPAELATDTATSLAVVIHALEHESTRHCAAPEMVAVLQITSPFRRPGLLRDAIALLQANAEACSVMAMTRLHVPAMHVYTPNDDGFIEPIGKNSSPALVPSGSLYVAKTQALKAQQSVMARPLLSIEVTGREAVDIDSSEDLEIAEILHSGARDRIR